MIRDKFDTGLARLLVLVVSCWGSWELYYLVAVLGFDASLNDLQNYSPLLLLLLAASVRLLWTIDWIDPPVNTALQVTCPRKPSRNVYFLVVLLAAAAAAIVWLVTESSLSSTPATYAYLWVGLLPVMLWLAYRFPPCAGLVASFQAAPDSRARLLDILVFLAVAAWLVFGLYGRGFATPDDAYYGHVITAALANPDSAVLAGDTLLGTDAPYTIHPAYRPVGYEILLALVSKVSGLDPLYLYFHVMAALNAALWTMAAYAFMSTLRVSLPGLAVASSIVLLSFWTAGFAPGSNFFSMFWGKSLLLLVAAPLLYVCVARWFCKPSVASWYLLLLAVAATVAWSSTATFLAPASIGLAVLVFAPALSKQSVTITLLPFMALLPVALAVAYTLWVLSYAPIADVGYNAGLLRVAGEAFGTLGMQQVLLCSLPLLLLVSRVSDDVVFRKISYRLAVVGFFTIMLPYLAEFGAVVLQTNFLARRIFYALPLFLVPGILLSTSLTLVFNRHSLPFGKTVVLLSLVTTFFIVQIYTVEKQFLFGDWWQQTSVYRNDIAEVEQARKLIPDDAVVAAGSAGEILPLLPNPPTFTRVRHYLGYYENFMGEWEFDRRNKLYHLLNNRRAMRGKSLAETLDILLMFSESLKVTTLVFHSPGGARRPESIYDTGGGVDETEQAEFVTALVSRLNADSYQCLSTPSGRTWVCNKKLIVQPENAQ